MSLYSVIINANGIQKEYLVYSSDSDIEQVALDVYSKLEAVETDFTLLSVKIKYTSISNGVYRIGQFPEAQGKLHVETLMDEPALSLSYIVNCNATRTVVIKDASTVDTSATDLCNMFANMLRCCQIDHVLDEQPVKFQKPQTKLFVSRIGADIEISWAQYENTWTSRKLLLWVDSIENFYLLLKECGIEYEEMA